MIKKRGKLTNNTTRKAGFSHIPHETVEAFIRLKMKESLTDEETQKLSEIEENIRYRPSTRAPHIPKAPWGPIESAIEYLNRVLMDD